MTAIIYIVETLLRLALFVFLVRLLLQLFRADFRNPISQAIVRLTNPLILPLRRVLPPVGKVDTASVVAVLLVAAVEIACLFELLGIGSRAPIEWAGAVLAEIGHTLLSTYLYAIFLYALLSLIAPGGYSPLQSVLAALCEPVLRPIRGLIPAIAGIDLSPLWAIIAIQALLFIPALNWR
ncbi:MAG: YggT family protein [Steroidobacteraceae bacterium]